MKPENERAGRRHLTGSGDANLRQAEHSTNAGGHCKRGSLRIMEAEADALERGAAILAQSPFANSGPAMEQLGLALELLLRAEAERKRLKLRNGKSLAELFPDRKTAEVTA